MAKQTKKAVALTYQSGKAPQISAKGTGASAEDILALAKEHNILIHQDQALTEFLSLLEVGEEIPEIIFTVIAELLSFSYLLQGKFPEHWQQDGIQHIDHKV
jgi:flagellar biosynthesis protein